MISIINKRNIWFSLSGIAVIASVVAMLVWGLQYGIDFTGGSLLEVEYSIQRPANTEVQSALETLGIGDVVVQPTGDQGSILRFVNVSEDTHQQVLKALQENFGTEQDITELRFNSIGPSIGQELKDKSITAMAIVLVAIIAYIAWAFRKVSRPVASWKYGLVAVIALFHDVMITVGVFSLLGVMYGVEVNAPFIAALLTILGYSVNDTIVVFDRIRENLIRRAGEEFNKVVDISIHEVITRSINSSFTTLAVLFAIFLLGGSTIRDFAFALIVGIAVGTYSSIFLASPLLSVLQKNKH